VDISKEAKKILFEDGISTVSMWLHDKGWTIDFDYLNKDEMSPTEKLVTVNTRQGIEKQLYSLLHECGHVLVQQNWLRYEKDYPATAKMNCYPSVNKRLERTPKYKVDVLSEEIEAWKRGKTLAKRLGIFLDEKKYNDLASRCIFSYVKWASK